MIMMSLGRRVSQRFSMMWTILFLDEPGYFLGSTLYNVITLGRGVVGGEGGGLAGVESSKFHTRNVISKKTILRDRGGGIDFRFSRFLIPKKASKHDVT